MNYVALFDVMNTVPACMKYISYVLPILLNFNEGLLKGIIDGFPTKCPL